MLVLVCVLFVLESVRFYSSSDLGYSPCLDGVGPPLFLVSV